MTKPVVFFEGTDTSGSIGLWETDGTAAGTLEVAVADAATGGLFAGDIPADFTQFGQIVLFTGTDAAGDQGLWETDGTAAGTTEIAVDGADSYGVRNAAFGQGGFAVLGDTAYFQGEDADGIYGLWSTQGSTATTQDVAVAGAENTGLAPSELTSFDGGTEILFAGFDQSIWQQLFLITASGVSEVADPDANGDFQVGLSSGFASLGNAVVFDASDTSDTAGGLWVSDGTSAGTQRIGPDAAYSDDLGIAPNFITSVGSIALFAGEAFSFGAPVREDLWVTGGTTASTTDLPAAGANAAGLLAGVTPDFTRLNATQILFVGNDAAGDLGLWSTDGTAAGTSEISVAGAFASGLFAADGTMVPEPRFTVLDGQMLFYGLDADGNEGLWTTDGTSAGTTEIAVVDANVNGVAPGDLATVNIACFAAGTRLLTERGEVPVERLAVGDRLRTHAGPLAPVRWLGRQRVACRRHPRPDQVWPVRVRAHAFADGQPHRDLLLSPDHALFVDGVLIPVRYLLNGRTVTQERRDAVTYWHVELPRHDVLLAEGLPAESYLDTGNRGAFANGGGATALQPALSRRIWATQSCAPLVTAGPRLAAAKRCLLARARGLGHATTAEPALTVLADGGALRAAMDGHCWRVRLPAGTTQARLVSRTWAPADMQPDASDTRTLGVAIGRLWLDRREVGLDSPGLGRGWHAPEPGWRWTDGDGTLAVAGMRELEFEVAMTGRYWQGPATGHGRAA